MLGDSIFSRLYNLKAGGRCSRRFTESGCRINGIYNLLDDGRFRTCDAIVLSIGINNIKSGDTKAALSLKKLIEFVSHI